MKKFIATTLIAAVLAVPLCAAADTVESEAMANVLVEIKSKIEIPENLTEFKNSSTMHSDKKTSYFFEWTDKLETERIQVRCNQNGEIEHYNHTNNDTEYDYSLRLPGFSSKAALGIAEEFLVKTVPETRISENDYFVYESKSSSAMGYTFNFVRYRDGVKVLGNSASISVEMVDDALQVSSLGVDLMYGTDYATSFAPTGEELSDPVTAYMQAFPIEMIYTDGYRKFRAGEESDNDEIRMVYRINDNEPGYIDAYTGEIIKYTGTDYVMPLYAQTFLGTGYVAADSTLAEKGFTVSEIQEIDTVASLMGADECREYLMQVPIIKISGDFREESSRLWVSDKDNGEYTREILLEESNKEKPRSMRAQFDAKRGKLIWLSNSDRNTEKTTENITDEQKNKRIDEFLEYVMGDTLSEFRLKEEDYTEDINRIYVRIVNGIPYIDDSVYVDYGRETGMVEYYSLNYNHHGEFADVSAAITPEAAYRAVLEDMPLEKVYVYDGERYVLAYGLTDNTVIDALTGKPVEENNEYNVENVKYSDISGHWCENAVNKLHEYEIAFNCSELRPDEPIQQADILRLFLAGIKEKYAMKYGTEQVYSRCYLMKTLDKEERNDTAAVTREQAFKYMISFMNYDTVAKLPDIYRVKYADGDMLSEGMTGYAAILSGMGIINGDGSTIRPKDYITRAEALTMVYNYLTSPMR